MTLTAIRSDLNWYILFLCWLTAGISTAGSLFFSEIMQFAPCVLCWYQRIFMFPLAAILMAGLFPFDKNIVRYAIPLAAGGWLTALYHTLLYSGAIPKGLQPCGQGVSCTEANLDIFGFITIPLLSLMAFSAIALLLIILKRRLSQ